jgi:hypothetical protein
MTKPHENSNILDLMDSSNLNFDDGSRKYVGVFVMQILISIYYVLHS